MSSAKLVSLGVPVPKFSLDQLDCQPRILIVGQPHSGKTMLINDILQHLISKKKVSHPLIYSNAKFYFEQSYDKIFYKIQ